MSERPEPHPPDQPLMTVADLRRVLEQLAPGWLIGVGDPANLHIFDERGRPQGFIDVTNTAVVMTDGIDDEP